MTTEVQSQQQFASLLKGESALVAIFWAKWSQPSTHLTVIADELSTQHPKIKFAKVFTDVIFYNLNGSFLILD